MALYSSRNICLCPLKLLALKSTQYSISSWIHQSNKDDTGILDDFTAQLMERKSDKWERKKIFAQKKVKAPTIPISDFVKDYSESNIKVLDIESINDLFQKAIDYDDSVAINGLIKQCIRFDKIPSLRILLQVLSTCSRRGDKNMIIETSQLIERIRPEILQENSNFEHYMAEAIWVKGNVVKSLNIFKRIYKENVYLRRRIRSILRCLILGSVSRHSEATVVNLVQFSDDLVKDYNDYFPLGCLWQACILSEWFADQQLALDFLDKYPALCNVIVNKIPFVVRISLIHHRTEIVYRLTETLLKFKLKPEVSHVIMALLNYWIAEGGVRQCNEIISWSMENDIRLPIINNAKQLKFVTKEVPAKIKSDAPTRTPSNYKF